MFELMDSLMQWRASLMMDGRMDDMAREFIFPFALYVGGGWKSFADPEMLALCFASTMQSRLNRGIVRMETKVVAMDLPRDGRFRVWVDHNDYAASGLVSDRYSSVNYCRETAQGVRTEMLHVYPLAGPPEMVSVIDVMARCSA